MSSTSSPSRISSKIRIGAAALAATAAMLVAGCGSSAPGKHHRNVSQLTFASSHTAQQIAQHFRASTGESLTITDTASWTTLSLPSTSTQDYNRFGVFTIDVLHSPDELSVFTTQNGHKLTPDAQGVYWPLNADSNGYWDPAKVYGNVVLTWSTQTHATNEQFTLLNAILSTLGQGTAAVDAKLPASELSCDAQGITPSGTREGTCTDNGVTRTVVGRNHTLRAPSFDVQVKQTKLGKWIKPRDGFDPTVYAKGAFVVMQLNVANTGSSPLDGLDEAELEVDGKYYSQDIDAGFIWDSLNTFPLQPGDNGPTVLVFDVPVPVALRATTQGELVTPMDRDDDIEFATKLGAIRLAEPTAEGGHGSAATPAPAPAPAPAGGTSSV
ncbi:MAG TPA: hypothetical protein VGF91_18990 [Solirubrobacteraceae bacterium]